MNDRTKAVGFATLAVHAGATVGEGKADPASSISSATAVPAGPTGARLGPHGLAEGRPNDPVVAMLEERVAALEGGSAAVAVASGQSARVVALGTLMLPGDELVASRHLSAASISQFEHAFRSFGWQARWADPERPESFVDALTDRTRAIVCGSLGDPGGDVVDLEAIARVAQRARVPFLVDNTLAPPYLLRPFEHGADVVIHSATGFLGGNGGALGGVVVDGGTFDWAGDPRYPALTTPCSPADGIVLADTFGNYAFAVACRVLGLRSLGSAMAAPAASALLGGIATLPLRVQRHCDNARAVAQHLSRHPAVAWVRYGGLAGDPSHALARRYCPRGAGAVVTFSPCGGAEAGTRLVARLKLFSRCSKVGDTRSTVIDQAFSDHHPRDGGSPAPNAATIRLAIGIEDKDDIIADLDRALAA